MKKRLIVLMLAGLVATTTLAGCGDVEEPVEEVQQLEGIDIDKKAPSGYYVCESARITDKHISVEQKDKYVLHKGDVIFFNDSPLNSRYDTAINLTKMEFDCGKEYVSNASYSLSNEMPDEEMYDEICEECFSNDQ